MSTKANGSKRVYRVEPPDELSQNGNYAQWRPERLTVREGIRQTAIPVLIGYLVLIAVQTAVSVCVLLHAAQTVTLPALFGLTDMTFATPILVIGALAILLYFIYSDLIRRSAAKTLLLIPLLYSALVISLLVSV